MQNVVTEDEEPIPVVLLANKVTLFFCFVLLLFNTASAPTAVKQWTIPAID